MRSKLLTLIVPPALALTATAALAQPARNRNAAPASGPDKTCVDPALDAPVDCVPTTFDTFDIPFADLPGGRMDANGNLDKTSSPEDAHAGAFVAAEKLGLFRNFEWLHWVPTAPSKRDAETGEWSGGDLDGFPTGWGSTRPRHRRRLPLLGPQQLDEYHGPGRASRREDLQDPREPGSSSAGRGRRHAATRPSRTARRPCATASCARTRTRPATARSACSWCAPPPPARAAT